MRKTGNDIFVGEKPKNGKKPARTLLVIILAVIVVAAAGFFAFRYIKLVKPVRTVVVEEKSELKIYCPSPGGKLITKTIRIKNTIPDREKADAIVASLKDSKAMPETLSLTDFASDNDGMLILNFSSDMTIVKLAPLKEIQTVYCIVNSFLANFTKAKKVQLLAGGQAFATMSGAIYTYKPLEFNANVLED